MNLIAETSSTQGGLEESESGCDTRENSESRAFALSEVATLNGNGNDFLFTKQTQVFLICLVLFNSNVQLIVFSLGDYTNKMTFWSFTLLSESQKILHI